MSIVNESSEQFLHGDTPSEGTCCSGETVPAQAKPGGPEALSKAG